MAEELTTLASETASQCHFFMEKNRAVDGMLLSLQSQFPNSNLYKL